MEQYIYINDYGAKFYYKDREMTILHRLDGPAVECADGSNAWFIDGKPHRLDGPAVEYADGSKEWFIDGKHLSEKQFDALTAPTIELTLEEIAAKFGVDASKLKIKK
jgi:hypothetical protein